MVFTAILWFSKYVFDYNMEGRQRSWHQNFYLETVRFTVYCVLLENADTFWLISFDNPMERPFCVTASELSSFYRVPAPQDFSPKEQDLSSATQQRLALIQPLLDRNMEAITDRQLRLSIAKDIAKQQNKDSGSLSGRTNRSLWQSR